MPEYDMIIRNGTIVDGTGRLPAVVSLPNADKYRGLTRRPSQGQKGLDERALMASQRPSPRW